MQDSHAIGVGGVGGGGRLFAGGSGGGGDRRLRPGQHNSHNHQQALKCPRCDSLNTKFCYYNNYNLSQPRHFCKSCRRYWTKGGVLRNVPVGGGCRKTKRSSKKNQSSSSSAAVTSSEVPPERSSNNSHSSSESSSLTATTTAAKKTAPAPSAAAAAAAGVSTGEVASVSDSAGNLLNFGDSRFFSFDQSQPLIDPIGTSSERQQMFTDMGSFTSLMTSSNDPGMLSFTPNMADISGFGLQQSNEQGSGVDDHNPNQLVGGGELKMEQQISCGGYVDHTSHHIGFPGLEQNRRGGNGGLSGLDWQMNNGGGGGVGGDGGGGGEQGLFDFTGAVDQTYWGQNQWSDHDQSLNFPPLV